jgi:exonuclease 1
MGITGLLPLLKPVTKVNHISSYKNKRIAIDGYAWLHKAVYGCCLELATGVDSDKWVSYCLKLIDMLLFNQIIVHMVFDGANLPAKNVTEEARAANRAKYLASGLKLLHSTDRNDQFLCRSDLVKAVDVTPRMAGQLMKVLRETRPEVLLTLMSHILLIDTVQRRKVLCLNLNELSDLNALTPGSYCH